MSERDGMDGKGVESGAQRDLRLAEALDALPVPMLSEGFYDRLLAAIAADAEGREGLVSTDVETIGGTGTAALGASPDAAPDEARDAALAEELARLPVPELSEGFYSRLVANIEAEGGAREHGGVIASLLARAALRHSTRSWLRVAAVAASIAVVATVATIFAARTGPSGSPTAPIASTRDVPEVALAQYRVPLDLAVRDYSGRFAVLAAPAKARPAATKALAVLDFQSGKVSALVTRPTHGGSGWKIDGVRVSDDWVVWQESGHTSGGPAYALYAARILDGPALGAPRLLVESGARRAAAPTADGPFRFAVAGDYVVYDVPAAPAPATPSPAPTATVAPSPEPSATPSASPSVEPSASPSPTLTATTAPAQQEATEGAAAASPTSLAETPAPAATPMKSASERTAKSVTAEAETVKAEVAKAEPEKAGTAQPQPVWALVSAELSTGRVATLARSVERPVFTVDDDEVVLWRGSSDSFVTLDLQTGRRLSKVRVVVAPRGTVAAFAAESGWMAWIQSTGATAGENASGSLVARDPEGNRYLLGGGLSSPWFAEGYLLYEGGDGTLWAFDLSRKDAVRLGERATGSGLLLRAEDAGRTLVAGKTPSRAGIVTVYRLSSGGGPDAGRSPSASHPTD